jgi:hypothetical protein
MSDRQRIITYASQATEEQLSEAIETFLAIRAGRFPKERKRAATTRKARVQKATVAQPELPAMPDEAEATSELEVKTPRRKIDKFLPAPHMLNAIEENKRERISDTVAN